jgi:hypothetical protein
MVYLRIRENSMQAKLMLEYLKTLSFVDVIEKDKIPNGITLKAINDAEQGKVTKAKNTKDLMTQLNK